MYQVTCWYCGDLNLRPDLAGAPELEFCNTRCEAKSKALDTVTNAVRDMLDAIEEEIE